MTISLKRCHQNNSHYPASHTSEIRRQITLSHKGYHQANSHHLTSHSIEIRKTDHIISQWFHQANSHLTSATSEDDSHYLTRIPPNQVTLSHISLQRNPKTDHMVSQGYYTTNTTHTDDLTPTSHFCFKRNHQDKTTSINQHHKLSRTDLASQSKRKPSLRIVYIISNTAGNKTNSSHHSFSENGTSLRIVSTSNTTRNRLIAHIIVSVKTGLLSASWFQHY